MQVSKVEIMGLESSLVASGYSMRTELDEEFSDKCAVRGSKLSKAERGEDQCLTGIRINFDLKCSNKMWVEAERYRFLEFVSSQSTMHRLPRFDLETVYNEFVDPRIVEVMKEKIKAYNDATEPALKKRLYLEALYSNPAGFELTARLTTNYRCLKNIYYQRRNHRLPEWREFCSWIESLPMAKELILVHDTDSEC